jgi:hypothetical protein
MKINFRGQMVEDRSGIDEDKQYRCTDCGKVTFGKDLSLVSYQTSMEVRGELVPTGEMVINTRLCPEDRGHVVEEI